MEQQSILERIDRILRDLSEWIFYGAIPITPMTHMEGRYGSVDEADQSTAPRTTFTAASTWGGSNSYCWLSATLDLPAEYKGKPLWVSVSTEAPERAETARMSTFVSKPQKRWDLMNPQFLLLVNGNAVQGLDTNHLDANITSYCSSQRLRIDFQGYAGLTDRRYGFFAELRVCNEDVRALYYDLLTAYETALSLSKDHPGRITIVTLLNHAVTLLDLRKPHSEEFNRSVKEATAFLCKELYDRDWGDTGMETTCIGHTHIDVAWLWDLAQTRDKARRSFSTVLNLMDQYPEFTFLQSQPQLYAWIKEDYPELFERIRAAVHDGRWEPEGAMWLEPDCNLTSGESLVRQILYGKRFYQEEFGVDTRILWLPDVFGYSAALPQILNKSGVDGFVTSKISWNSRNKMPYDTFLWQGIDGSETLAYFITTPDPWQDVEESFGTVYNAQLHPSSVLGGWKRYQQQDINRDILLAYGFGDGGGGPTEEMLEKGRRLRKGLPGMPKLKMGNLRTYMETLRETVNGNPQLPRWVGELYLELHQGTYTSNAEVKLNNRRTEILLHDAEIFLSFARALGHPGDPAELADAWRTLLLNQFHDILPGTCIEQVYNDSRVQFQQIREAASIALERAARHIGSSICVGQPCIALFNTLSFARDDVAVVPLAKGLSLIDDNGVHCPMERLGDKEALVFVKNLPAMGYRLFTIVQEEPPLTDPAPGKEASTVLENRFFRIELDQKGCITRLYDVTNGREVLTEGTRANRLLAFDDRPASWDTWNLDCYYGEKHWEIEEDALVSSVVSSPVRRYLRVRKRFQGSEIVQKIVLYNDIPRIDFETEVDWQADSIALKVAFPIDVNSDYATYEIQFGNVRRPTHANTAWDAARYEVCAHKWADLSEKGYGVSLLNDCKYGHDIRHGEMRLTLLKAGMAPYAGVDRGKHWFTYSLFPHAGSYAEAGTVRMAQMLNTPVRAFTVQEGDGVSERAASLFSVGHPDVVIDTVKPAEDGDGLILRCYESVNSRVRTTITSLFPLESVQECDLLEAPLCTLPHADRAVSLEWKPFEIKTLRFRLSE